MGTIDVWLADLDDPGSVAWNVQLAAGERTRADSFVQQRDGRRWQASRAILRLLIADALGLAAEAVPIEADRRGKLRLTSEAPPVHFNHSHSGRWALYALCSAAPVGVDVEERRPLHGDPVSMAAHSLGAEAARTIADVPPAEQEPAFLRAWVSWEAGLKCHGAGITDQRAPIPPQWEYQLDLGAHLFGAVVSATAAQSVRLRHWSGSLRR